MENKEKRLYKIVLTGGPCGGKTTGQSRLCTFFENLGWKVFRVPETATVLLSGGIKFSDLSAQEGYFVQLDGYDVGGVGSAGENENTFKRSSHVRVGLVLDLSSDRLRCAQCKAKCTGHGESSEAFKFQENLLKTMIQIENTFFALGESCNRNCLIICDRGAMDASAFISQEKWQRMMSDNNWNPVELRDNRYNQIVHMVSAAYGAEDFYSTEDHACRSEGIDLARELDYNAAAAWVGHPYFDVIDNNSDFETKICRMIDSICTKLGIDTGDRLLTSSRKRKFLVKSPLPDNSVFPKFQDFDVVHNYLQTTTPKMQARLRKRGQNGHWSYIHTLRKPKIRDQIVEVRTQLSHRDYINMLSQKDDSHFTIYKKRRCFLVKKQYFQLDSYQEPCHSRCKGLILLETYSSADDVNLQKCLPPFLTIIGEVTGDPSYSMFNLSLKEEWNCTKKFCHSLKGSEEEIPPTDGLTNGVRKSCVINGK